MLSLGVLYLRAPRRLFAGKERSLHEILRASQGITDGPLYERVLATEHTPSGPFCLLERGHGLAEIVERGAAIAAERRRVRCPHPEHEVFILSENASRHGYYFTEQRLGFFKALYTNKDTRIVVGCREG